MLVFWRPNFIIGYGIYADFAVRNTVASMKRPQLSGSQNTRTSMVPRMLPRLQPSLRLRPALLKLQPPLTAKHHQPARKLKQPERKTMMERNEKDMMEKLRKRKQSESA